MKSKLPILVISISLIGIFLVSTIPALTQHPEYPDLNLSPLRVINTDSDHQKDDQIQSCSYFLAKSDIPPLAPRLNGADFLTIPDPGLLLFKYTFSGRTPEEASAHNTSLNDFRCSI